MSIMCVHDEKSKMEGARAGKEEDQVSQKENQKVPGRKRNTKKKQQKKKVIEWRLFAT